MKLIISNNKFIFNHSATIEYETVDPLLGIQGLNYFLKQWAATLPLEHSILSPINGDLTGLGHITLVIGTKELLYPFIFNRC